MKPTKTIKVGRIGEKGERISEVLARIAEAKRAFPFDTALLSKTDLENIRAVFYYAELQVIARACEEGEEV